MPHHEAFPSRATTLRPQEAKLESVSVNRDPHAAARAVEDRFVSRRQLLMVVAESSWVMGF